MFYTNRIFSQLHVKSQKDLKSAEMTISVYMENNKNKSCPQKLRKSWKKNKRKKNGMLKKTEF